MYGGPIVKFEHRGEVRYFVWSTIGSGPSMGMSLEQLRAVIEDYHGKNGLQTLDEERLPRVEQFGTSSHVYTRDDLMKYHYEDEFGQREISLDELWDRYVEGDCCLRCHYATRIDDLDEEHHCNREDCRAGPDLRRGRLNHGQNR